MRKEIAALRDFSPLNVRFGSFAPDRYVTGSCGMSASPQKRTSFSLFPPPALCERHRGPACLRIRDREAVVMQRWRRFADAIEDQG
jgi:hypothetical protein